MNKILVFLVLGLFCFSSCFYKIDEKKSKGSDVVEINLSTISKGALSYEIEKIVVKLTNVDNKKVYVAEGEKTNDLKKNLIFEDIPYGTYNIVIEVYKNYEENPYSRIKSQIVVGSETPVFSGCIGGPCEPLGLSAQLKYYTEEPDSIYVDFECSLVTSNLVEDTNGSDITYYLYWSTTADFSDEKLLVKIDPFENRHPINTLADKIVFKKGKFLKGSDEELPLNLINGQSYYWKVVASRIVNGQEKRSESRVQKIISEKYVVDNKPNKVQEGRYPENNFEFWVPFKGFSWTPVLSVSEDINFNNIDYILYISENVNFSEENTYKIERQLSDNAWVSDDRRSVTVNYDNSLQYSSIGEKLKKGVKYYWKVEAKNSEGSSMSDTYVFYLGDFSPNKIKAVSITGTSYSVDPPVISGNDDSSAVMFSWDKVMNQSGVEDYSYDLITYSIYISENPTDFSSAQYYTISLLEEIYYIPNEKISISLEDLKNAGYNIEASSPAITYYYKIKAENYEGFSESDVFNFKYSMD